MDIATRLDGGLADLSEAAAILTPYATLYRYPDTPLEPDDADLQEAVSRSESGPGSLGTKDYEIRAVAPARVFLSPLGITAADGEWLASAIFVGRGKRAGARVIYYRIRILRVLHAARQWPPVRA